MKHFEVTVKHGKKRWIFEVELADNEGTRSILRIVKEKLLRSRRRGGFKITRIIRKD